MMVYIERTPEVAERYLDAPLDNSSRRVVEALALGRSAVITGCGTSYHLALAMARYLRDLARVDTQAIPSHDLAWYSPTVTRDKVLIAISHSGATKATLEAVTQAGTEASLVVSISAHHETKLAKAAEVSLALPGGWEEALPKTMTYVGGSLQALRLAWEVRNVQLSGRSSPVADGGALRRALEAALNYNNRETVKRAAKAWSSLEMFHFIGGGPGWIAAIEAALKMRENNYTCSEGYEVEEMAHGRIPSLGPGRAMVGIVLEGPSAVRTEQVMRSAAHVGSPTMALVEEGVKWPVKCDFELRIPNCGSEYTAAIVAIMPLQLLSNFLAVEKGYDPDTIRHDDPKYAYAQSTWIFPPGTH